ncbi:MAG: hypothetical protein ACYCTE_09190 [Acidimicrobiales bacterium]
MPIVASALGFPQRRHASSAARRSQASYLSSRRSAPLLLGRHEQGHIALVGWLRGNSLNGGIASFGDAPVADLVVILLGMPVFAAIVGWLLAGREPTAMARQPIE